MPGVQAMSLLDRFCQLLESASLKKESTIAMQAILPCRGCVFTRDINKAILISEAMETGTIQINSAPARAGPFSSPGFEGQWSWISNSINMMTKEKSTVINLPTFTYAMG
ncbi:unnamed protein product [Camellia sinensis]